MTKEKNNPQQLETTTDSIKQMQYTCSLLDPSVNQLWNWSTVLGFHSTAHNCDTVAYFNTSVFRLHKDKTH